MLFQNLRLNHLEILFNVVMLCFRFQGALSGKFYELDNLSMEDQAYLKARRIPIAKPKSEALNISGVTRDWPDGRAVYYGHDNGRFAIGVNCDEQLVMNIMVYDSNIKVDFSFSCPKFIFP